MTIPNNWAPFRHQLPALYRLDGGCKRAILLWHRRAGKDSTALNWVAKELAHKPMSALYLLPEFKQAKRVLFRELNSKGERHIDQAFPEIIRASKPNETEGIVRLRNGSIFQIGGFDSIDSYVGVGPKIVVLSEFAVSQHGERAWNVIVPILLANGGVAIFPFTPRGKNHGYSLYERNKDNPDWYVSRLTIEDTGLVPVEAIEAEVAAGMDEEYARQEFWVSFESPNSGSYYGRLLEQLEERGQITDVPHDPSLPVYTWWDIGIHDATAIWCVQPERGGRVRIIDYIEDEGEGLAYYLDILNDRTKREGWTFAPRGQLVPHDFATRNFATRESPEEVARKLGWRMTIVPRDEIHHGIDASRRLLPRCWLDRTRTGQGRERLGAYRKRWFDQLQRFTGPLHDPASHCFTGDTRILTRHGARRIMDLPDMGEVLTPCGWSVYRNPRITRTNAPLVEVAFGDGSTVRCTPDHLFLTERGWRSAELLQRGTLIQSFSTHSGIFSRARYIGGGRVAARILSEAAKACIALCGRQLSAIFHKAATYITETIIQATMPSQILSACQPTGTSLRLGTFRRSACILHSTSPRMLARRPRNGTPPQRGDSGIAATLRNIAHGRSGLALKGPASDVACSSWRLPDRGEVIRSTVATAAKQPYIERAARRQPGAGRLLTAAVKLHGRARRKSAIIAAGLIKVSFAKAFSRNTAPVAARHLPVTGVMTLSERADVWCLSVPEAECFALANGAIAHNCADAFRTGAMGMGLAGMLAPNVKQAEHAERAAMAGPVPVIAPTDFSPWPSTARKEEGHGAASGWGSMRR